MILYFLNGKAIDPPKDLYFSELGSGVFETMRVKRLSNEQVKILGFDLHLDRAQQSILQVGLSPFLNHELRSFAKAAIEAFDWKQNKNAKLRFVFLDGNVGCSIESWEPELGSGVVVSVESERDSPNLKSTNVSVSKTAYDLALKSDAQEAFLVDREGILREGAWSNVFWIDKDETIVTPRTKILPGISRSIVLKIAERKYSILEKDVSFQEILLEAREIFYTQATNGVVPVLSLDQKIIGDGEVGMVTQSFMDDYRSLELALTDRFSIHP